MVFDNAADNTQMVERVAAEFNQLNFYVSQCADLPFVRQAAKVCIHVCASLFNLIRVKKLTQILSVTFRREGLFPLSNTQMASHLVTSC